MLHTSIDRHPDTPVPVELDTVPEASGGPSRSDSETNKEPVIPLGAAIFCLILVGLALRPGIVSIGPVLPDMISTFGLSYTQASLLTVIPTLLMGLLALPTPWLARRFGRDRVIMAALLLLALTTAARALSGSTAALFAATAGVGAGIAIAGTLVPGFVKASFPGRVALLMGVYAMALSTGGTLSAATTGALANIFETWRTPSALWAIPALVGVAAWHHIEGRRRVTQGAKATVQRHKLPTRNLTAWLVAAFFALNNFVFYSYVSWIAPMYVEFGSTPTSAGLILASFTLAFMVATPIFGAMSRNEDRRPWLVLVSGISLVGIVWMAIAPMYLPFAAVSLAAFGTGGAFTLGMTLPLDNARTDGEVRAWNAFVMLVSYLIGATGPLITGVLRDEIGGFDAPLWLLVVVSAAMLATTPFLQPYHHRVVAAAKRGRGPIKKGEAE